MNSRNTGDQIIADAVEAELRDLLPEATFLRIPTQTFLTRTERAMAKACAHFIVGGTNLLNGNIPQYLQWKIDPHTAALYKNRVSLLGVGWWQYNNAPNKISRRVWNTILKGGVHSVRDDYTSSALEDLGINSNNTTCPTLWRVENQIEFSEATPDSVIVTITDYHKDPVLDAQLIAGLQERYKNVIAWPQGSKDRDYLQHIARNIRFLGESLEDFNDALKSGEFDYVGTRLHAGIRALQYGVKSTIVAVDNRAPEISRSTNLPVISRSLASQDWKTVDSRSTLKLVLPETSINSWKQDFLFQF